MNTLNTKAALAAEWQNYWYLPLIAALGYSAIALQSYAMGPFMGPLQREFGWSRAEVFSGTTIANIGAGLLGAFVGMLIDRFGPRWVAMGGVLLMPGAIALLSTATGTMQNWAMLWVFIAFAMSWGLPTVWTNAIFSRFKEGSGMAVAITLSGPSFGALVLPPLSTWLINSYGWRDAFLGLGGIWALILFPLVFLFFHSAQDSGSKGRPVLPRSQSITGVHLKEGLRMPAFYKLMLAGGFFAFTIVGIVIHLVPILTDSGAAPMTAAVIASLLGLFSIAGRLFTGALLDRFPGHLVGAVTFLLPIPGCLILLGDSATTTVGQVIATASFGVTLGAEINIITYLAMRHFGLRHFGVLAGVLFTSVGVGGALGPLAAGMTYDRYHTYSPFLMATILLMALSVIALFSLRAPPRF